MRRDAYAEIPDELVARAEKLHVPGETLVAQALQQAGFVNAEPTTEALGQLQSRRREAFRKLAEIQSLSKLGGVDIKSLIEEGRRV